MGNRNIHFQIFRFKEPFFGFYFDVYWTYLPLADRVGVEPTSARFGDECFPIKLPTFVDVYALHDSWHTLNHTLIFLSLLLAYYM